MPQRDITVRITPGTILTAILFIIGAALLWYLRDIVLILLTAVVIASAMEPGIHALERQGLPRILSIICIYLIVAAIFIGIVLFFLPPVLNDAASFLAQLPNTLHSIDFSADSSSILPISDIAGLLSSADLIRNFSSALGGSTGGLLTALSAFFGGIVSFILVVVFSFYFCVQETGVEDFLRIITPVEQHGYVLGLWKRAKDKIGKWMQGQLMLGLIIGVLLFLGLTILQVPYALLLAVLAAIFELIPVFGQILAAIPSVAIAFATGGAGLALLVLGLFIIVQQFESNLIYPLVVKKVVGLPPLLVILALIVGGKLAGFVGVLLAVPLAAALREFVNDIESHRRTRKPVSQGEGK
ncbi:MAG: AI-2E family transporter [Patescibacteria group bacterium]|nr:AI-2E family transporter [Patescibacteria group bacterium]